MENKYSLTFPQKNIWLVEEFFGKSPINTIVGIFNVNKEFNFGLCEKAINKMVEVNDALRLKIMKDENNTYQYIEQYRWFNVDYFDITNQESISKEELEKKLLLTSFDVIGNPLYYFAVVRLAKDRGYIFVKLHHLVSDAWTFGNVATELGEYIDMFSGKESILNEKPSYIDFIESEKEYINSQKFNKDREFWQEYLYGIDETVGLKENPNKTLIDAKRYSVKLDNYLNETIKNFCKTNRVSPYIVFMNALAIYMHRVTEKTDFVIGTPILNRSNFKEKKMMGMFVSTMPVRFKIDEQTTFLDMCKKSAVETMTLFRHQKYPYSLMIQDFREKNNLTSNIYDVMISYQNARASYSDNEKYTTDWLFSTKVQDQFAIHIMDMDETGVLEVHFDYLTDLFEDIEIEYIAKRLFTIIKDGIENNKTIETIEIMPEEEKNKILYEFNDTKTDYPKDKTVIDLFEEQVEKTPDNIALVFEGNKLTYRELNNRANSLANYLKEKGIMPKDNIGIMQDRGIDIVITILALLKLGVAYVPMDANSTLTSRRHIIKNAMLRFIISDVERASIDNTKIINICNIPDNYKTVFHNGKSEDIINVMYTSGTTGAPKGVEITNKNIIKLVRNTNYIKFTNEDVMLQTGSYTFDASTLELWNALLNGIPLHIVKNELLNPEQFKHYIKDNKITIIFLTTAIFNQMIAYDPTIFENVRLLMTGGEVMSVEHVKRVMRSCPNLVLENLYGPTENTVVSTYYPVKGNENIIPIGKPISNTTCYILDSKLRLLPLSVDGILYVGGDGVASGYINNKELTNNRFIKDILSEKKLYNTGDIARFTNDGNLLFLGRKDNEIKIKGIRVDLDEIKNKVNGFSCIQVNEVLCMEDDKSNKYLALAFVSTKKEDIYDLKKYLKIFMPISILPRKIVQLEKMPLTVNGKIDKKELKKIFNKISIHSENTIKFEGIYQKLYNLFKDILGISDISLDDDFFELGGDSILGVNLITQAIKENISITYNDLYKYRTIRELGNMIISGRDLKQISNDIGQYDYSKINKLLESGQNRINSFMCDNIILTGATGFLGIHILAEFINTRNGIAYCLIRKSATASAKDRLVERLKYYFNDKYISYIDNRIIVIEYEDNMTKEFLDSLKLNNVTHFINSLALVKHYGELEEFYMVNVKTVELISNFCIKNSIELIHISTLSVSGDIVETAKNISQREIHKRVYTENNLYLNQTLDNVYAYTKFIAERIILEKIINESLSAKILRMGNLLDRISDNKFQINEKDNAFSTRLKALISIGVVPEEIRKEKVDITPIDSAAKVVNLVLDIKEPQVVYHLFNNKKIIIEKIVSILNNMDLVISFTNNENVAEAIHNAVDKDNTNKINGIIVDITKDSNLKYITDVEVTNDITMKILSKYGFDWPEISELYLLNVLKRIVRL